MDVGLWRECLGLCLSLLKEIPLWLYQKDQSRHMKYFMSSFCEFGISGISSLEDKG
jgi:hypothetical protein